MVALANQYNPIQDSSIRTYSGAKTEDRDINPSEGAQLTTVTYHKKYVR